MWGEAELVSDGVVRSGVSETCGLRLGDALVCKWGGLLQALGNVGISKDRKENRVALQTTKGDKVI